ncbi:MAG: PAS-domain containing protein [Pelagimonas sp.]|uniref:PAS-domain containing protein n=1 Tax=Pelagimonas sp. TaxID=2073170 RepID=UPI003D6A2084
MDDTQAQAGVPQTLTALLRGPDAAQTLALLQDTLDAMKDAVALWDEDMKLVLHNRQFTQMVLPEGFRPLEVGEDGIAFARELFHSGAYVMLEGMSPDQLAERMGEIIRDFTADMEIERTNGRVLGAVSKRTALGGYLLNVFDKTDTKRAEAAEAKKLEAVNDAVEALEEGFSLWDADMKFLFCNDRYMEIVFPPDYPRIEPGANATEVVPKFFEGDRLIVPEGVPTEALVQDVIDWITSFGGAREFYFRDGRVMRAAPHRTKLGGFLITVTDVTEVRNAEAKRLEAVNDAVGGLEEGFVLMDHDLNFMLCNPRFMELTYPQGHPQLEPGTSARDAMRVLYDTGELMLGRIDREDFAEQTVQWIKELRAPREYHFKNGRVTRTRVTKTALGGYLALIRDVTEERNTQAKARDMLFDAIESLEEGFALYDEDLRFVTCNQNYVDMALFYRGSPYTLGSSLEEHARESFRSGAVDLPPGVTEDIMAADVVAWISGAGEPREFTFKTGRIIRMTAKRTALGGFMVTVMDLTQERNSEAKARELVFDAMESLEEGFALWDSEWRFVMCNQKHINIVIPYRDTPYDVGAHATDTIREAVESGIYVIPDGVTPDEFMAGFEEWTQQYGNSIDVRFTDGRTVVMTPHKTDLGGFLLTSIDVTEERNSEARARDMLLDAFQSLDDGLVLCDADMNYVFGNDSWKRMMFDGLEQNIPQPGDSVIDNLIGHVRSGYYAIPEGQSQDDYIAWMMGEMAQHGKQIHYSAADGRHFVGSSHQTSFGGALLFIRDVTEVERAEERRLEAVTDALNAADYPMVLFSGDRSFVLANDAWYRMIAPTGLVPTTGDDGEAFFKAMIDSGYFIIPDGLTPAELYQVGLASIYGYNREFPLTTSDGRLFLGSSSKTALGGFLISYRDITEQTRTQQELEQQRETVHQNEKLSALGELLAGVAHELNNPLSVVFGYSQMLQGKVSDPVTAERIDLICQSAERAAKIVKTFLAMARQRPTKIETCSINDIATTALEVSSYSLKSNGTEVLTHFDPDAPPIQGDFDQLAQVFSNLIINAGHAVEAQRGAGQIVVKSFYDAVRDETVVEIRDNGRGIPKDIQTRIFEPFFTTKEVGEGTGVGLAFSHRIISSHEGALDLQSAPGKGTSFFVRLKAADEAEIDATNQNTVAGALGPKRVLVLDDEEGVAQLVADLLTDEGLHVTKMTNPRKALRLVASQTFDAVVSDFKMPDMDGRSFFEAARALVPEIATRVGFMTGDAMSAHVAAFLVQSGCPHIEKPIVKEELMALLAQISAPSETAT